LIAVAQQTQKAAYLTEQDEAATDELAELIKGLSGTPKKIAPKYFYDERGSHLFDRICQLPEYYLTRTELAIMHQHAGDMSALAGPRASLIEFGSGSSVKIRVLLQHLVELAAYVPVDISRDHLVAAADAIAADFPGIEVLPVAADFTHPFDLPDPKIPPLRNIVYFPGSTIGNFSPAAALDLLKVMWQEAGLGGGLLIGIDLQKDPLIIERAYNDASGVTAEFNLNVLRRLNDEFGANFDLDTYRHEALYNAEAGRIEMYLVSERDQVFRVGGRSFTIWAGERILTEHSHKYTLPGFAAMAGAAGFNLEEAWTDENQMFAVCYFSRQ
jgi:dimethylhistidine N-methyltransferase